MSKEGKRECTKRSKRKRERARKRMNFRSEVLLNPVVLFLYSVGGSV